VGQNAVMTRLFGTDGVRGVANTELTPDLALTLGRAAGRELAPGGGLVLVGRDTRVSGPMLEGALVAGLCSAGAEVGLTGVIPTPAVAFLTVDEGAAAGAVISASHNPVPDNGIKFFSHEGFKISTEVETAIEHGMESPIDSLPTGRDVGTARRFERAVERYIGHLLGALDAPLEGLKVVLDCAYGAAWEVAPRVFKEAGADVIAIHDAPDGTRINVDCGSTSPDELGRVVVSESAHLGLAFDGDADRVLAVDERGDLVDGDRIIAMAALRMHDEGTLKNNLVVATVMTNLGFHRALEERGIEVLAAPVGDRYVAEAMADRGASLGGEQSGHVIFADHSTTGDGVLTGLKVAEMVATASQPLSELGRVFHTYPQVLINVRVRSRAALDSSEPVWTEVKKAEGELGAEGRVLLRASGTEPVVRVMVEAVDDATARRTAEALADVVTRELGA
jgi:phosphoglucosamine mutase